MQQKLGLVYQNDEFISHYPHLCHSDQKDRQTLNMQIL